MSLSGWETHSDRFEGTPRQAAVLDQAMSALFADLKAKGLLGETLVVLGTEFGRTPRINDNDGLEQRVRQWDNHSCGPRDKRPAGGPPGQGVAGPDVGGPGHRVRLHAQDQR